MPNVLKNTLVTRQALDGRGARESSQESTATVKGQHGDGLNLGRNSSKEKKQMNSGCAA